MTGKIDINITFPSISQAWHLTTSPSKTSATLSCSPQWHDVLKGAHVRFMLERVAPK